MNPLKQVDFPTVYLHPAEMVICDEPTRVITVLGSCVSVTMFNPRLRVGAICHGTLPKCKALRDCHEPCIEAYRFMDCTLRFMLRGMREFGISNNEIEIKIFGGADTLMSRSSNTIGSQNIRTTLGIMEKEKLRVIAADVGDSFGRKLVFFSHTGEAYVKRLKNGKKESP